MAFTFNTSESEPRRGDIIIEINKKTNPNPEGVTLLYIGIPTS